MDIEIAASIAKVTLQTKSIASLVIRRCKMAFDREFDAEIASALGSGARKALAALKAGDLEQCTLSIDRVNVEAKLVCGKDKVSIRACHGEKATAKAGKDPEDPPTIRLAFEAVYTDDVWSFLGRNCGSHVQLAFKDTQLTLGGQLVHGPFDGGVRPV